MKDNKENIRLVPELRFEEFVGDGAWKVEPLKKVFSIFQGYAFSSKDSIEKGTRWLKIADVSFQKMNHNNPSFLPDNYVTTYNKFLIKKGDYVLALTRPILNGNLKISAVDDLLHNSLLNQRVGKLVTNENATLVYYLLQTNYLIKEIEKSIAGSEPPNLSMKQIANIVISLPSNPVEQQKIAATLSSLDDLLQAETERLALLKEHKKGLLQQLFPKQGEKVPQLRFEEFVGDGDWEEKYIGEALIGESSQIAKNKLNLINNGYPIYGADGLIGYIGTFSQNYDYIAVVKDGSGVGNLFLYKKESSLLGTLTYLLSKDEKKYNLTCLYYLLQTIDFKPFVKGSGIPHIYFKDYSKLKIYLPTPQEQQKIANTLSSVDKLIETQAEKIAALKAHKKGLMQGMFPKINTL